MSKNKQNKPQTPAPKPAATNSQPASTTDSEAAKKAAEENGSAKEEPEAKKPEGEGEDNQGEAPNKSEAGEADKAPDVKPKEDSAPAEKTKKAVVPAKKAVVPKPVQTDAEKAKELMATLNVKVMYKVGKYWFSKKEYAEQCEKSKGDKLQTFE